MRGHYLYNFPAFDNAKENLSRMGWNPISPADMDRAKGHDPKDLPDDHDWDTFPSVLDLADVVQADTKVVTEVDAIYMLDGWETSKGATAEKAVAEWMRKPVIYESVPQDEDILEEALRITGGDRQASYGPPDQDFRRTAEMWSGYLHYQLKSGFRFEPFHVASMMILLKQSRQMHQRKRDNWTDTAGYARCGNICDEAAK